MALVFVLLALLAAVAVTAFLDHRKKQAAAYRNSIQYRQAQTSAELDDVVRQVRIRADEVRGRRQPGEYRVADSFGTTYFQ